jgi:hypothetical protein
LKEGAILATDRQVQDTNSELTELKAVIADQQRRLDILESRGNGPMREAVVDASDAKESRSTRRQMLKLAGATLVGAAGGAALKAAPVFAYNGDTLVVGTTRTQQLNNQTGVSLVGTAAPGRVFRAAAYNGVTGQHALHGGGFGPSGIGVAGYGGFAAPGQDDTPVGVYGYGYSDSFKSIGVHGAQFSYGTPPPARGVGTGVLGYSYNGSGVVAQTRNGSFGAFAISYTTTYGVGVAGYAGFTSGLGVGGVGAIGVEGIGVTSSSPAIWARNLGGGPDFAGGGTGRLSVVANITAGFAGAPNYTPKPSYFETVRKGDGGLWVNNGSAGAVGQAAWKPINAVRVDSAAGTGAPFAPWRVYDSRSGAKKAAGTTFIVPIAGLGAGASAIPANAVAIFGNLTATQYTGGGLLALSPAGVAVTTSSVNFITGQVSTGNSFIVGLGTGGSNAGKVQVKVLGHATHVIIDVTGYIQ